MLPEDRFEWEGRSVACARSKENGPPVIFCHGTPFSSIVWSQYAAAISNDFQVHIWDMPGYGQSSKNADHAVDFDSQARAFASLIKDFWKLDKPHVVAHDFGGCVALRAALTYGIEYASLMLVDPVSIPPTGSPFFRFVQKHPTVLKEVPAYIHEAIVRAYIGKASYIGLSETFLEKLVAPWITEEGQSAFYRQIEHYDESFLVENEKNISKLGMPVHLIWGIDDIWIPIDLGRKLASLIPRCRFTEVPEAGHLLQYDAPVILSSLVRSWLDEQTKRE